MSKKFFLVKRQKLNSHFISKLEERTATRDSQLEALRKEYDLVGFVFAASGRPDYFLKEMGSEVDETKFKVGRVNRAGNDFLALEPIDFDIVDRLSLTFLPDLVEIVGREIMLISSFRHYQYAKLSAKQEGHLVLLEVDTELNYRIPVALVEISESQYTDPDIEQLKTLTL